MARILTPRELTREAFAPFGDVIEPAGAARQNEINYGYTTRFDDLAALDLTDEGGRPLVSLFRSTPPAYPFEIAIMENHPLGSQAFVPLGAPPFLVVVAPPGPLEASAITAFRTRPGQGVNYHRGVWHHFCLATGATSDFLVIDRGGPGENLIEITLPAGERPLLSPVGDEEALHAG